MSTESSRWLDLVSEMQAAVWEEAPLHEISQATVDLWGADGRTVHGPWSTAECQSVLLPWLGAGWVDLVADVEPPWPLEPSEWQSRAKRDGTFLILSAADAKELLDDPARWVLGTADGHAMLCRTEKSQERGFSEWLEVARQAM